MTAASIFSLDALQTPTANGGGGMFGGTPSLPAASSLFSSPEPVAASQPASAGAGLFSSVALPQTPGAPPAAQSIKSEQYGTNDWGDFDENAVADDVKQAKAPEQANAEQAAQEAKAVTLKAKHAKLEQLKQRRAKLEQRKAEKLKAEQAKAEAAKAEGQAKVDRARLVQEATEKADREATQARLEQAAKAEAERVRLEEEEWANAEQVRFEQEQIAKEAELAERAQEAKKRAETETARVRLE